MVSPSTEQHTKTILDNAMLQLFISAHGTSIFVNICIVWTCEELDPVEMLLSKYGLLQLKEALINCFINTIEIEINNEL